MKYLTILSILLFANLCLKAQETDADGCSDYPLFNRMPNFYINECELKDFEAYQFRVSNSTNDDATFKTVEGKYYYYNYNKNEDDKTISALQIFRNFENAFKQMNALVVAKVFETNNSYSFITAKAVNGKNEIWINLTADDNAYFIYIIEKELMTQVIQANEMLDALNKDGYIALDILFDTGKSTIKEESLPTISQIYELLNSNSTLKVSIEGHTDNVGTPESNKTLSDSRAKSVVASLVSKGIDKTRLSAVGWGQERPVADNRTEEGRAKNRRVEIVKK